MRIKIVGFIGLLLIVASGLFANIYLDDLNILGPDDELQFQIYSPSNSEQNPVMMTVYKVDDCFSIFLNGMKKDNIESIIKQSKEYLSYKISISHSWQRETIPLIFFSELGSYLVKLTRDGKDYYTCVERSDIKGVAIDLGSQVMLKIWNSRNGEKITFGDIYSGFDKVHLVSLRDPGMDKIEKSVIRDGLLIIKTPKGNSIVKVEQNENIIHNNVELIFLSEKPIYRPGEQINVKGYLYDIQRMQLIDSGQVNIALTDPMGVNLMETKIAVDEWGGFDFSYETVEDSIRGHYDVSIEYEKNSYYRYVELADYNKPEFVVKVDNIKDCYSLGQVPEYSVGAEYYYGQLLDKGNLHLQLDMLPDYQNTYSSQSIDMRYTPLIDGEATGVLKIKAEGIERYCAEFTVVDQSGREVSETKCFNYIPSDVRIHTQKWKYWHNFKNDITGEFNLEALTEEAVISDRGFAFEIYRKGNLISDKVYKPDDKSIIHFSFDPIIPGYYVLKIIDLKYPKNQIEKDFFVYSSDYTYSTNEKLEIISDKEVYKPSEVVNLKVISSIKTFDFTAILDFGNSLMIKDMKIKDNQSDISFVIPSDVSRNNISLKLLGFFGGESISKEIQIPLILDRYDLDISIAVPNQTKPGERVDLVVKMNDNEDNPVNGVMSLNVIDQALLDLYGDDEWKDVLSPLENPPLNYYFKYFNNVYYLRDRALNNQSLYETPDTLAQTKRAATGKSVKVRSDFSDSALWMPGVVVNGEFKSEYQIPENLTTWNTRVIGFSKDGRKGYTSKNFVSTLPVTVNEIFPKFLISKDEVELGLNLGNYSGESLSFTVTFEAPGLTESRIVDLADKSSSIQWFRYKVPEVAQKELFTFKLSALSDLYSDAMEHEIIVHPYEFSVKKGAAGIIVRDDVQYNQYIPVESEVTLSVSADLEGELIRALEYLIGYPYGCTEQTVSSFLPSLAFLELKSEADVQALPEAFKRIPDITQTSLKRLYSFQNYYGGWGWWKKQESDPFMTAYVMYTFYKLNKIGYDINSTVYSRGKDALARVMASDSEPSPFGEYVLSLLDPSYTIILTDKTSLSSKLFLALSMVERGQMQVAKTLLEEILEKGNSVGGIFKVNFDKTDYFIDDIQLNSLLLELMSKCDYTGEEMTGLFKYLFGKKTGGFWESTKDTAFVVMALSNYIINENNYEFSLVVNSSKNEIAKTATGTLESGQKRSFSFKLNNPDMLGITLMGSSGLMWEIKINESWDPLDEGLQSYCESGHSLSRTIEVKKGVRVNSLDDGISHHWVYVPINSEVHLDMIAQVGTQLPEDFAPLTIKQFKIFRTPESSSGELYLNGSQTGLIINNNVRLIGMNSTSLTFDRDPFSYEEGEWTFFFKKSEATLKVGDEIRSTINIDLEHNYNWSVMEENIPVCFVHNENYSHDYSYYGKYYSFRSYGWNYHTSNVENRYDKTSAFFKYIEESPSVFRNYYKVICAGEFVVPPLKLYQMYETDSDIIAPGMKISVEH